MYKIYNYVRIDYRVRVLQNKDSNKDIDIEKILTEWIPNNYSLPTFRYTLSIQTTTICLPQYALKYELRKNTKLRSPFSLAIIVVYAI